MLGSFYPFRTSEPERPLQGRRQLLSTLVLVIDRARYLSMAGLVLCLILIAFE